MPMLNQVAHQRAGDLVVIWSDGRHARRGVADRNHRPAVAGKLCVHNERRAGAGIDIASRAEHAARGDRGGAYETCDLCSDSSHTYEHSTYD